MSPTLSEIDELQKRLDERYASRKRQGKKIGIHIVNDLNRRLEMEALREQKVAKANKRRRFP